MEKCFNPNAHLGTLLVLLILGSCALGVASEEEASDFLKAVCPNALKQGDPNCKNGGALHARNTTDYTDCAFCDCPPEWKGSTCELCTDASFCPDVAFEGEIIKADSCIDDKIEPTPYEFSNGVGKAISCFCGGDGTSKFLCQTQPGTNLQIRVNPPENSTTPEFTISALQRAGIPSQDYRPSCDGEVDCPTKIRYSYAFPQVWEGVFQKCRWSTGPCLTPLSGNGCVNYVCPFADIQCPAKGVVKCPGWTPWGCGNPPGESRPYWSHHCNPLATPQEDKSTKISCSPNRMSNGAFQCYMSQPQIPIPSVGLQCFTGTCVYPHLEPDFHHHKKDQSKGGMRRWIREHSEFLLLMILRVLMLALVILAFLLIARDKKRSLRRARMWGLNQHSSTVNKVDIPEYVPFSNPPKEEEMEPVEGAFVWFGGINYHVAGKHILKDVCGVAARDPAVHGSRPGSILAIMGPSGAGKTSLLDILSGNISRGVSGSVFVDGNHFSAGSHQLKRIMGYVCQEDILPGTSTVFEYLIFHASLRLPRSIPQKEKESRVFSVIRDLGLEKVCHNFIGDQFTRGLSGGEKRRVSICCELLVGPRIMLLDEPTTGLDSTNAAKVVEILFNMAQKGINSVMTIHQPRTDVFRSIDRVMLMSGNGEVVYAGPSAATEAYFSSCGYTSPHETVHIVDHMLDVTITSQARELRSLVSSFWKSNVLREESTYASNLMDNPKPIQFKRHCAGFMKQVRCLSTRLLRNASRHPVLVTVNFLANLVVALLLGVVFFRTGKETEGIQSRLGVLFFIQLFLSMMSLSSLPVWRSEKLLFLRERNAGVYRTTSYFLSVLLFDLIPLRVLPAVVFSVISYEMIGLHKNCAVCILWFTLVVVLSNVVATLMNMMIGAGSPSVGIANIVGSMVVMIFVLFGGFLLNKDDVPKYCSWIAKMSYINYGYEALAVNEFHSATNFNFSPPVNASIIPPLRVSGDLILCEFGFEKDKLNRDVVALLVIGIICAVATYLLLCMSGRQLLSGFIARIFCCKSDRNSRRDAKKVHHPGQIYDRSWEEPDDNESNEAEVPNCSEEESRGGWIRHEDHGVNTEVEEPPKKNLDPIFSKVLGLQKLMKRNQDVPLQNPLLQPSQTARICSPSTEACQASSLGSRRVQESLTIAWNNVTCKVWSTLGQRGTQILQGVCGVAGPELHGRAGRSSGSMLFAIMGPSGAGKTTLMDILAGRKRGSGVFGDVSINGHPVTARQVRKLSGYVLQEDVLPGTSTVLECMMFHAKLRLPPHTPEAELLLNVLDICKQLGLKKVLHSRIGDSFVRGLSGGEKRRLSIACELLEEPGLMFLDEPTTGLDSTNAAKVVDILSRMARSGVTVIMSIHQPRANFFRLIDRMLMLSGNGQVAYTGSVELAAAHLESLGHEPNSKSLHIADFMLDLIIKSPPAEVDKIINAYRSSGAHAKDEEWRVHLMRGGGSNGAADKFIFSIPQKYAASHSRQLEVLSSRMRRHLLRHPMLVLLNFLSSLCVAFGLGAVYYDQQKDTPGIQNRMGSLFFVLMYFGLMSLSSMPVWHEDRLLFVRERASGLYGTTSYFLSILIFDIIPMRIVPPILFGTISYPLIGFRLGGYHWSYFILIAILVNVVASTLSMMIGAAISSTSTANMVASLWILSVTLLGGFFLGRRQIQGGDFLNKIIDAISRLSYVRYAFEALMVNEFDDAKGFFLTVSYRCLPFEGKKPHIPIEGDAILKTFGFPTSPSAYWINVIALCVFIVIHLTCMYFLVKLRGRPA